MKSVVGVSVVGVSVVGVSVVGVSIVGVSGEQLKQITGNSRGLTRSSTT